mgnify:CR=1 FL=1
MRKIIILILCLLVTRDVFALHELASARQQFFKEKFKRRLGFRNEVRSKELNILEDGFTHSHKNELVKYFIDMDYKIRRFVIGKDTIGNGYKFDLIFWKANSTALHQSIPNFVVLLKDGGVFFIEINELREFELKRACAFYKLEANKIDKTHFVIKRSWDDYDLFEQVANELTAIISMEIAA